MPKFYEKSLVFRKDRKNGDGMSSLILFFSGKFTLESLSNPHNENVWARNAVEIPLTIRNRRRNKFTIGVVFWGGISYDGLIPKNGPIDVTSWLKAQVKENRRQKTYMNGRLYAKFIKEVDYPVKKSF